MPIDSTLIFSASIAEYTNVNGFAPFNLLGGITGHFTFAAAEGRLTGDEVTYHATDGPNVEIGVGIYTEIFGDTPATISRDTILTSTNGDERVFWSGNTRPIIRELTTGSGAASLELCSTTPWDGADLVWQTSGSNWCPDNRVIGRPADTASGLPGANTTIAGGRGDGAAAGGRPIIIGGNGGTTGNGGQVSIRGGVPGTNRTGGHIFVEGEDSNGTGDGGDVVLIAGRGGTGVTGDGGVIDIESGDARGNGGAGGDMFFTCGEGRGSFNGGSFEVFCGNAGDPSGAGAGNAGDVLIFAGEAFGTGRGGDIQLFSGDSDQGSPENGGDIFLFAGDGDNAISTAKGGIVEIDAGHGYDGGDIVLGPGNAGTSSGKIGVIWFYDTTPIVGGPPTTNPSVGYYIYIDTTDGNKLKIRGASGTVATLAVP